MAETWMPWGGGGNASSGAGTGGPTSGPIVEDDATQGCRFASDFWVPWDGNSPPEPDSTPRYKLTACGTGTTLYTILDLSAYVGTVVKIGSECYTVSEVEDVGSNPFSEPTIASSHSGCAACDPITTTCPGDTGDYKIRDYFDGFFGDFLYANNSCLAYGNHAVGSPPGRWDGTFTNFASGSGTCAIFPSPTGVPNQQWRIRTKADGDLGQPISGGFALRWNLGPPTEFVVNVSMNMGGTQLWAVYRKTHGGGWAGRYTLHEKGANVCEPSDLPNDLVIESV